MSKICIYHKGCTDGFAAAYIFKQQNPSCRHFLPLQCGTTLDRFLADNPDVPWSEADVWMLDVTFPTSEEHLAFAAKCHRFAVVDHHKTAQEKVVSLDGHGLTVFFDLNESGATLTAQVLEYPLLRFFQYVRDRDLWLWELPSSKEFSAGLASYPQNFAVWDKLVGDPERLIAEGAPILRYQQNCVERSQKHARVFEQRVFLDKALPRQCKFSMLNCTHLISELGNHLVNLHGLDFACLYFFCDQEQKWVYSLRSKGDFDVSKIAELFGGGGHKNASGFSV